MTRTFEQTVYATADAIATITLNRPDRLNAFTPIMRREMIEALDTADGDDAIRVVVVTGSGRAFCAGADIGGDGGKPFSYAGAGKRDALSDTDEIVGLPRDGGGIVALRLAAMRKPVIAAINGAAVGVGVTMRLPMDIRVAAESAKFGFVFARRGIAPEATSSWFLPRVVGIAQAMEWTLTGRVFGAGEAKAGGLVSHVVPDGAVLDKAMELAREIAKNNSPVSLAATRRMMWSMLGESSPWTAHALETGIIHELKKGVDAAEGVAAFLQKRPAEFRSSVDEDLPAVVPEWPQRPDEYSR